MTGGRLCASVWLEFLWWMNVRRLSFRACAPGAMSQISIVLQRKSDTQRPTNCLKKPPSLGGIWLRILRNVKILHRNRYKHDIDIQIFIFS